MKRLIPEFEFDSAQQQAVRALAETVGITATTAGILYARGFTSEQSMREFLHPSKKHFLSPLLMQGMKEAVSLITKARDEGWNVAVFGDYDADGIGASTILSRALKEFGVEPYIYIPERAEGYGLSVEAIDKIFDEFLPDLLITVDCGISCAREVAYIQESGAEVIVTDHHELPDVLPDCICINPKLKDDYPYDNLCGAGVALKLSVALIGERAYELLDFCAISTVADSVPLLGENRDIVAEGLKKINETPRLAISALIGKAETVTAQTIAYTVAPRINAAGRMGNARLALQLFLSDDEEEILTIVEALNRYNSERQRLCDELYETARAQIRKKGAYGNIIMTVGENWHSGLIGIVAARLAEEFSRPALLFVKRGDMLRGSARSIENVNIFEALKGSSEYIEEFGGHAQAAGVNVRVENAEHLEAALNRYLEEHYTEADFRPMLTVCKNDGDDPLALARELNLLEPFGVGNKRPLFAVEAEKLYASPLKPFSPHLVFSEGGMEYLYFNGEKDLRILKSDVPKTIVFEYNLSKFRGKESLKCYVRGFVYSGEDGNVECEGLESELLSLKSGRTVAADKLSKEQLEALLQEKLKCRYGLCVVVYRKETLKELPLLAGLPVDVFEPSTGSVQNIVLLSPSPNADLSAFRDIVYPETVECITQKTGNANIYYGILAEGHMKAHALSREPLLNVYTAIRNAGILEGDTYAEAAKNCDAFGFESGQFIYALAVFEELGLIERGNGVFRVVRGIKTDLKNSVIYTRTSEE